MRNKKFITILSGLIVSSLFLSGCKEKNDSSIEKTAERPSVTVGVMEIKPSDMEDYIEFGGSVNAVDTVSVLPNVSGKVAAILVEAGDKVQKNQIIAKIDPSKPGAEFALSPVKASASGTVTAVFPSVGAYVTTSSAVAEVSSTDRLEIKINVSERFVSLIKMNQIAEVTFKSYPDEKFNGEVIKVSPILDPVTRTLQVILNIKDSKNIIKSGMFAHEKLTTEQKKDILALPNRSILYNLGKPFVYQVVEKGGDATASKVEVETGLSVDGMTEIKNGISDGMKIIVKGQNLVSDGQKVKSIAE
ncbi:MAG: efflux RND transporter periplasmic adaptor subunit [Treponema sp.]|nr:efflux RND transporter periplasmic adaptor subunit [Treponema sp.]